MKKLKITPVLLIILCLVMIISGCLQREKEDQNSENKPIPVPSMMEEIESDLLEIMGKVDLIPYYESQIKAKKEKEAEAKTEKEATKDDKSESIDFKPDPITLNDIILYEIIMQEKPAGEEIEEKVIPDDIIFLWQKINSKITALHEKWNRLEIKLQENQISQQAIAGFDDQLNHLTTAGNSQQHMATLLHANTLTSYFPQFASGFRSKFPLSIYYINYYVRQIVLDSANLESRKVMENLSLLKKQEEALAAHLIKEKAKEEANMLKTSISDLEQSISYKDLNIIKIKAGVVLKNIGMITEKLARNSD